MKPKDVSTRIDKAYRSGLWPLARNFGLSMDDHVCLEKGTLLGEVEGEGELSLYFQISVHSLDSDAVDSYDVYHPEIVIKLIHETLLDLRYSLRHDCDDSVVVYVERLT